MLYLNGKVYHIPGVYGVQKVTQLGGGELIDFNTGLVVGKSMKGAPYNSSEIGSELMLAYDSPNALARDYGYDELYEAFLEAKKAGAGVMFVLNAQPNTKASAAIQDITPADVLNVEAARKNYGVFGNDIQIGISESASNDILSSGTATAGASTTLTDSGKTWGTTQYVAKWVKITGGLGVGQSRKIVSHTATELTVAAWTINPNTTSTYEIVDPKFQITVVPTKNEKIVKANIANGVSFCYVNNIIGLSAGMSVDLMTNLGKIGSFIISEVDSVYNSSVGGYKIIFTTAVGSANGTTANYARILNSDVDNQYVVTFSAAEWTLDTVVLKMNAEQGELVFSKESDAVVTLPVPFATTYLSLISGATKGLNPAVSENDYATICNLFPDWSAEFEKTNSIFVRNILWVTSSATVHAMAKELSKVMAEQKYKKPTINIAGTALGDVTTSALITRLQALNSDNFILCGIGLDSRPAYLSLAPRIFGIKISNPLNHNMTRDLIDAATVEKEWSYTELEAVIKKGLLTVQSSKTGYRIVQGINTYQDHSVEWNQEDAKTYLIMQRDLADYFYVGLIEELDRLIGADGVNENKITIAANLFANRIISEGYITDYVMKELTRLTGGWLVKTSVKLPGETDFIGLISYVESGA